MMRLKLLFFLSWHLTGTHMMMHPDPGLFATDAFLSVENSDHFTVTSWRDTLFLSIGSRFSRANWDGFHDHAFSRKRVYI